MTRKDYVLIARAIRSVYTARFPLTENTQNIAKHGIRAVVLALQRELQTDNPAFNPDRFAEAALGPEFAELP